MFAIKKPLNHPKVDPEKRFLLCQKCDELNRKVDEHGVSHDMPRTHGYSVKGKRSYGKQELGCQK
ncbi:hypothetical protein [Holospora curviuscula]|uniref:hypothetical protein n=1 Tax=Holospora curviuscula TaxID=1082868 RepID=UPI00101ADD48|nr:hypothetical protein [Holospora curviuscula]